MPRVSRVARTPDSGYKFDCQGCEEEVYQAPYPQLVFALTMKGKGARARVETSEPLQCCIDCAEEIEKDNAAISKALGLNKPQVREVRPLEETHPELAEAKRIFDENAAKAATASNSTDAKLDKLIDMMTMFMQVQMGAAPPAVSPPATTEVKANAESKAEKPKPVKKTPTKRKPSSRKRA